MKKQILTIVLIVLLTSISFAQDNCSKYYPLVEGSSFEYTNYDKKDKLTGTVNYVVTEVHSEGSATSATFNLKYKDKKGKDVYEADHSFSCENGVVKIDFKSLFPSKMMQQYSEMDVDMDITGSDIEIPNNLKVGEQLPDANISIAMNMSGIKMNMSVDRTNRIVEKKETITTAAGTFNCYVLVENNTSSTMGASFVGVAKTWIAEGVGMVKNEVYKKNGNLETKSVLTKFNK